jgi:hypothetical protein
MQYMPCREDRIHHASAQILGLDSRNASRIKVTTDNGQALDCVSGPKLVVEPDGIEPTTSTMPSYGFLRIIKDLPCDTRVFEGTRHEGVGRILHVGEIVEAVAEYHLVAPAGGPHHRLEHLAQQTAVRAL